MKILISNCLLFVIVLLRLPESTAQVPVIGNGGLGNGSAGVWGLQGNSGQGNWLGTSDSSDLVLKSFGLERLRLGADGLITSTGAFQVGRMKVTGLTELDSVRSVHIRANRISSEHVGDSLIFFGDSSIVMDHTNHHIYAVDHDDVMDLRLQCFTPQQMSPNESNNTILNESMGNVGIGTGSPQAKLHVSGNVRITGSKFHVSSAGNIGIGTSSPQSRFDVRNTSGAYALRIQSDGLVIAGQLSGSGSTARVHFGDGNHYIGSTFGQGLSLGTYNAVDAIKIKENSGQVVIANSLSVGTESIYGYALAVKGHVIAEEFKVKTFGTWPDYVFKEGYKLMPISELTDFIECNQHLPNVPNANEIANNGYGLAVMNEVLLRKIEELTLYIIQLEHRVQQIESTKN